MVSFAGEARHRLLPLPRSTELPGGGAGPGAVLGLAQAGAAVLGLLWRFGGDRRLVSARVCAVWSVSAEPCGLSKGSSQSLCGKVCDLVALLYMKHHMLEKKGIVTFPC